ncbi:MULTISPECIES: amidohydrolase family protein [unclassified Rhodococcus (in: high G+C Gram-positive bacteria)]|uniref:N-acetylglucosamine-6-phosphate deacetylase n=1 Tax=unclassified Rhodococcus (in: high G+C Gram-positive bacteria) TaxID=192944 RepID=UPI0027DEFB76|nr:MULTISPECIES: amidohydrolase family protein [unclassified Rhodococcus (in: high G+C Gram-positive bacteria)]
MTLLRGRVVLVDGVLEDGVVEFEDDRIVRVGPARGRTDIAVPPSSSTILPGMVDVHCHGGGGAGFPDATADAVDAAVAHHVRSGTTTMLASLVSAPREVLVDRTTLLANLWRRGDIAGVHLEGPFLARSRCGAQDPAAIVPGDPRLLEAVVTAGGGAVRSMTLAPETANLDALARVMAENDIRPSVGHTDADAATVTAALARLTGPVSATHLFNGMPPLHHRSPGPVAACLAAAGRGEMVLELIGDGVHLDSWTVAMVVDLVGPDGIVFVSDAMAAAGMSDGPYRLGSLDVTVADGVARLTQDGDEPGAIAGGTSTVLDIVRRAVAESGVDLVSAVRMGATTPARFLGLQDTVGRLAAGMRADIVITDADLTVTSVVRRGRVEVGVPDGDRHP